MKKLILFLTILSPIFAAVSTEGNKYKAAEVVEEDVCKPCKMINKVCNPSFEDP